MSQEEDEEETASLADALTVMQRRWSTFKANDVADLINRKDADAGLELDTLHEINADSATVRDFLFGAARLVSWRRRKPSAPAAGPCR